MVGVRCLGQRFQPQQVGEAKPQETTRADFEEVAPMKTLAVGPVMCGHAVALSVSIREAPLSPVLGGEGSGVRGLCSQ